MAIFMTGHWHVLTREWMEDPILSDPEWVADVVGPVPLQRAARVEDIAGAIRFLASSEAAYITGQVLAVDGGVSTSSLSAVPRRPQFASSLTVSP